MQRTSLKTLGGGGGGGGGVRVERSPSLFALPVYTLIFKTQFNSICVLLPDAARHEIRLRRLYFLTAVKSRAGEVCVNICPSTWTPLITRALNQTAAMNLYLRPTPPPPRLRTRRPK